MAKYGIPYMGSKGPIADWLIGNLPEAKNFYDLFGGGFAATHAAMLSGKWSNFHFNEISPGICEMIQSSINGDFSYNKFKPPFIGRDEFHANKANDAYTRCIWSFGNNQRHYLFGKHIEDKKRSGHNAVVFGEIDDFAREVLGFNSWSDVGLSDDSMIKERRLFWRKSCFGNKTRGLERLERLEQLSFSTADYRQVLIKKDSVVYCDPPYKGTSTYSKTPFDYDAFYDWALKSSHPVFISEYDMPGEFKEIAWKDKKQKLCATKTRRVYREKIYANPVAVEIAKKRIEAV